MTKAQKDNQLRFKKAQAEAKRLKAKNPNLTHTAAVKQAFKNLGGTSAKPAAKKVGAVKSKGSIAGVFKFAGAGFQDVRQFDIYGDLSYIIEDSFGQKLAEITGNPKNNDLAARKIYAYVLREAGTDGKGVYEKKIKQFVKQLQTEAAEYNKGKKSSAKPAKSFIPAAAAKAPAKKKVTSKKEYVTVLGQRVLKGSKAYEKLIYTKKHSDDLLKSETSSYIPKKQTGKTSIAIDRKIQALPVGKRISKSGNVYYETRANRSDKGRLLGVKKPAVSKHKDTNSHNVKISIMSGVKKYAVDKFFAHDEYKKVLDKISRFEKSLELFKQAYPSLKTKEYKEQIRKEIAYVKKMLTEYKTHARELKKLL
jgi:hypothetical protein